jgi:anaerobic magnesium-protoporphyrin IX monomethyl ester cyclase
MARMRVLLVRPPSVLGRMARQNLQHPTNLLGLAAEVRARGHEAALLDMEVVPGGLSAFERAVAGWEPDIVGLSVVTPHVPGAADLAKLARLARPAVFLVAGGPHATALPGDLLSEIPALDAVCVGEGDLTLPDVCDALGALTERARASVGREDALVGIPGLVLREHGSTGAREPLMDLDVLAPMDRSMLDWPAYERLAGHKGVASPGVIRGGIRATQVHLSRGCYANCVFCSTNAVWGERARPGIRRRSVAAVLEEIDRVVADFGVNHLNFEDDTFPPTLRYLEELGEALVARRAAAGGGAGAAGRNGRGGRPRAGLTWSCNARVDGLRREHFELMAAAGCVKIDFGVESGSDRILELNRKLVTRERVVHVFAEAKRAGILRTAYLMLGSHVDETPEEVAMTARLAREIAPDYITFTIGCPYPGTETWETCKERGYLELLPTGRPDWKRYGYYPGLPPWRFTHFTPRQMLATQQRVLRGFYMNPRFVLRMIGRVRSATEFAALVTAGLDVRSFLRGQRLPPAAGGG